MSCFTMDALITTLTNISKDELNMIDMSVITKKSAFQGYVEQSAGNQPYRFMKFLLDTMSQDKPNLMVSIVGLGRDGHIQTISSHDNVKVDAYGAYASRVYCDPEASVCFKLPNVNQMVGNLDMSGDQIYRSDVIVFDMHPHDGYTETEFINILKNRNYCGVVVLTCIHLNDEMSRMWSGIQVEKLDVSSKAHWGGTGVVFFRGHTNANIGVIKEHERTAELIQVYEFRLSQAMTNLNLQSMLTQRYQTELIATQREVQELKKALQTKEHDNVLVVFDGDETLYDVEDPFLTCAAKAALRRQESFNNSAYGKRVKMVIQGQLKQGGQNKK